MALLFGTHLFSAPPNFGAFDGTAVMLDLNSSKRVIYNDARADERLAPCSTFKILNSIISLDTEAVKDENETVKWDGVVREYPSWNRDHTMRSAFPISAVWFYQEMAKRVGSGMMQVGVTAAQYGNMNTTHTLTDFWLAGGSLKISANEEVDFLAKMLKGELPFLPRSVAITKDIMTIERKGDYTFGGKTGSCDGIGWFVGFVEKGGNTKVFAVNIKGDGANGVKAKEIAIDYMGGVK